LPFTTKLHAEQTACRTKYPCALEKTQLDEKQYIAYEMIACTFLLGFVNDGCDKNTKLGAYLQQTMEITSTTDANDIINKLKARGGRDQLLMFLTGLAGSGKSSP
jgi:hypothetical protein